MKTARPTSARILAAVALASAVMVAHAHDTWFEPLAAAQGGTLLALGTGNQYPRFDSGIDAKYLVARGCRGSAAGKTGALQAVRNTDFTLVLRAPPQSGACWAQLTPFEIELAADKIEIYMKDIQATPEIRATWAAMQQRGLPWHERYTKHSRIELGAIDSQPAPMGLDVHIEGADGPLQVGQTITAQALRDGAPLPGLALELRSENSPLGIWRRTDAQGRIQVPLPLPGRWVLRGVDLRVSAADADRWDSRFVTLAFDVAARVQNGSHLTLNTRSTNQAPATSAISSEPPVSTTRR